MAFAHARNFNIYGSTFNSVSGNQAIHTYNDCQVIQFPRSMNDFHKSQISVACTSNPGDIFTVKIPNISPYRELVNIILEIQDALFPLDALLSETRLFDPLNDELGELLQVVVFLGRYAEIIVDPWGLPDRYLIKVKKNVIAYVSTLKSFLDDVRICRDGLRFTMIGPLWRRVLWAFMWTLSSDASIHNIVNRITASTREYCRALQSFLVLLSSEICSRSYIDRFMVRNREDLERLEKTLHSALPFLKRVKLDFVRVLDFQKRPKDVPLTFCSSLEDLQAVIRWCPVDYNWRDFTYDELIESKEDRIIKTLDFSKLRAGAMLKMTTTKDVSVYYKDNINICSNCGHLCTFRSESPQLNWVTCDACRNEFVVRVNHEVSDTSLDTRANTPSSHSIPIQEVVTTIPAKSTVDLGGGRSFFAGRMKRLTVNYANISWQAVITCQNLENLYGQALDVIKILRLLAAIGSPLRACSVRLEWCGSCNIIIPRVFRRNWGPDDRNHYVSLCLPQLKSFTIYVGSHQDAWELLENILLPNLTSFTLISTEKLETEARLLAFLCRSTSLTHITINNVADYTFRTSLCIALADVLPHLPNLQHLSLRLTQTFRHNPDLTCVFPKELMDSVMRTRQTHKELATVRAEYVSESASSGKIASQIQLWHPSPWVWYWQSYELGVNDIWAIRKLERVLPGPFELFTAECELDELIPKCAISSLSPVP